MDTVYSDPLEEGLHSFQYDITEQQDYLPPIAGGKDGIWHFVPRQVHNFPIFHYSHMGQLEGSSFYALDEIQYIYFPNRNPILSSVYDSGSRARPFIRVFFSMSVPIFRCVSSFLPLHQASQSHPHLPSLIVTGRLENLSIGLDPLFSFQKHTRTIKVYL